VQFGAAWCPWLFLNGSGYMQDCSQLHAAQFFDFVFVLDNDLNQPATVADVNEGQASKQALFVQPTFNGYSFADMADGFIAKSSHEYLQSLV
jgi:hypothetical protein